MRRMTAFANRILKEILRDQLTVFFGLGFPLVVLLLLSLIQANIPVEMFEIHHLTPGITVFGLSFMTLFSAQMISHDRGSALLTRLYTTPLRAHEFILGYTLPILPLCIAQSIICYAVAMVLGLRFNINVVWAILMNIVPSLFYVSLGLLCGSAMNDKQVGGICGALLTNLSAWLSGIWFDVNMLGKVVTAFANALPFVHAVELERAMVIGNFRAALPHLWWVQPFLDSKTAAPPRKYLDSVKNRMNIGIDARNAQAIRAPSSVCFSSAKPEIYNGSVLSFSACAQSIGQSRLSHWFLNDRIPKVATTGVEFGRTILRKMLNSPRPSTREASRYSEGKVRRY